MVTISLILGFVLFLVLIVIYAVGRLTERVEYIERFLTDESSDGTTGQIPKDEG